MKKGKLIIKSAGVSRYTGIALFRPVGYSWVNSSNHKPHQGKKECARRVKQAQKAKIQ
jgi:hypothetical protein